MRFYRPHSKCSTYIRAYLDYLHSLPSQIPTGFPGSNFFHRWRFLCLPNTGLPMTGPGAGSFQNKHGGRIHVPSILSICHGTSMPMNANWAGRISAPLFTLLMSRKKRQLLTNSWFQFWFHSELLFSLL